MQQLPRRQWHQNPASPPPRLILEPAIFIQRVVCEFQRSRRYIDSYRDPQLVARVDAKRETSQTCSNCGGELGGQGL